jgi:predicted ATPase/class 3 adenylate cyclase
MPSFPESRTSTFLMTDIAGSTRLWEEQPAAMAVALAAHDAILREAVEHARGTIVKTTGDGMLAAFDVPRAAVDACLAGQRAMLDHDWPTEAPLSVRMALHAGSAEARDGDFFGPALNRVARLLAIGHGGQVLVSSAGAAVLADDLPTGVELLDRGEHRLKDLSRLEHVYQLVAPGLPSEFPPLRSGKAPTNLPAELTSFIGREREVTEIGGLLEANRLVSLVGVGGTGKTRLMLHVAGEAAGRHADGAWLVELAPLSDPGLVLPEVARALSIPDSPGQPLLDVVTDFLRDKDLLLLVDNCEHLIGAAADVTGRLLGTCRSLRVMATSREALGVPGEAIFQVPSLRVPETLDDTDLEAAASAEAVRLFVDRATGTLPTFRLDAATIGPVVEICRRLDGIPLALELAAARINVLTADDIAQGLGDRFRLLTGGRRTSVPRQQTLQALIDWSWDLLSESDQRLLRRLSVFVGGWTLDAAAEVTADRPAGAGPTPPPASRLDTLDGLGRLVDRSLVIAEHGGGTRFRMLETIRQYARDRLVASGESTELRTRHLARFRRMAEDAGPALEGAGMLATLEQLDIEIDNIRAALDWAFEAEPEAGVEIAASLGQYWRARSVGSEGLDRLAEAIEALRRLPEPEPDTAAERLRLAVRVLATAAREAAMTNRRIDAARDWGDEAVRLARESGDPRTLSTALAGRGFVLMFAGRSTDDVLAAQAETAIIAEEAGDWMSATMAAAARSEYLMGTDLADAETWVVRATEAARRAGNPFAVGLAALARGRYLGFCGRIDEARPWFAEAQAQFHEIRDHRLELVARSDLAHALRRAGDFDGAEAAYREVMPEWQRLGHRGAVANLLESFAFVAVERGDPRRAAVILGAAEQLRSASEASMLAPERVEYDREIAQARGALDEAEFEQAWSHGAGLTTEDSVAFAVSG